MLSNTIIVFNGHSPYLFSSRHNELSHLNTSTFLSIFTI